MLISQPTDLKVDFDFGNFFTYKTSIIYIVQL